MPESYLRWRKSRLGRITDALEADLLLERIGSPSGLNILDVGCGDGVLAVELAKRGAKVRGIDSSEAMIAAARQRAASDNIEIDFNRAAAESLPFADNQFDVVTAIAVLCFIDDPGAALREMARVLKPGGRLIVGELGRISLWALVRRVRGSFGSAVWRRAHFRTHRELSGLADEAGLTELSVAGAVFYPPFGLAARLMRGADRWLGKLTHLGAAFLVLAARKR